MGSSTSETWKTQTECFFLLRRRGGHYVCPRRPIHLPEKWLLSHARTEVTKYSRVPCLIRCHSSQLSHSERAGFPFWRYNHLTLCICVTVTLYRCMSQKIVFLKRVVQPITDMLFFLIFRWTINQKFTQIINVSSDASQKTHVSVWKTMNIRTDYSENRTIFIDTHSVSKV